MKFNQELITKARKGEIAILNDGTGDQLYEIIGQVASKEVIHFSIHDEYVYLSQIGEGWQGLRICNLPAHSVKDFFMPDTKDTEIAAAVSMESLKEPRKFKITRSQMKEFYEAIPGWQDKIYEWGNEIFFPFETEAKVGETFIQNLLHVSGGVADGLIRSAFPEYFIRKVLLYVKDLEENSIWEIHTIDASGKNRLGWLSGNCVDIGSNSNNFIGADIGIDAEMVYTSGRYDVSKNLCTLQNPPK